MKPYCKVLPTKRKYNYLLFCILPYIKSFITWTADLVWSCFVKEQNIFYSQQKKTKKGEQACISFLKYSFKHIIRFTTCLLS